MPRNQVTPFHTTNVLGAVGSCTFKRANRRETRARNHVATIDVAGSNPVSRSIVRR